LYRAADLYIHGGLAEGFGIPIIEAIAAGVPVITIDAKPMSELNRVSDARVRVAGQKIYVDRGIASYRLNIPDVDDYVELIDAMIYDKRLRDEVKAKQQSYILQYDVYKVYQRFRRWISL
jgi:glycosyltransferase involved in cell wall biosynthesis